MDNFSEHLKKGGIPLWTIYISMQLSLYKQSAEQHGVFFITLMGLIHINFVDVC